MDVYAYMSNGKVKFSKSRFKNSWKVGEFRLVEYDEIRDWVYIPVIGLSRQPDQEWLYWNSPNNLMMES